MAALNFDILAWLFVAAVALHNLGEAIWLPGWSRSAGKWHHPVGAGEFRFAVIVLTLVAAAAAWLAQMQGKGSCGAYLLAGYALGMLINVLFPHLLATVFLRRYAPGAVTAVLLNLPITAMLLHRAVAEEFVEPQLFAILGPAVVAALGLSIPFLFWLGRKLA